MKDSDLTKFIISAGIGFIGASMTANLLSNRHGFGAVLPTKPHDGLIGLSVKMAGVTLNDCIIDSGSQTQMRRKQTSPVIQNQ